MAGTVGRAHDRTVRGRKLTVVIYRTDDEGVSVGVPVCPRMR
jgi:hypothetical protein